MYLMNVTEGLLPTLCGYEEAVKPMIGRRKRTLDDDNEYYYLLSSRSFIVGNLEIGDCEHFLHYY